MNIFRAPYRAHCAVIFATAQLSCIKLLEFTGKSSANNSKQYRKLIQEDSERSYNQYILFKIAAVACHESGFWILESSPFSKIAAARRTRYFMA